MNGSLPLALIPLLALAGIAATTQPGPDSDAVEARRMMNAGSFGGARAALERLLERPGLAPAEVSILRLQRADCLAAEGDWEAAIRAYQQVIDLPETREASGIGIPAHHREEASERIEQVRRVRAGKAQWVEPARTAMPPLPSEPAFTLWVTPTGNDRNDGTEPKPFATLERARDAIRALRRTGRLPSGPIEVAIRGGKYPVTRTFEMTAEDSGTAASPVIFRAVVGEKPVFTGGIAVRSLKPIGDPAIRSRLPVVARDRVMEIDLAAHGISNVAPLALGGFSSGRGFKTHPLVELYYRGTPLELARGPNEGYCTIANVTDADPIAMHGLKGSKVGRFFYAGDRADRWAGEENLLLYGYWFFGWADSYELVKSIDPQKNEVILEPPYHGYGYRNGQWFYAVNAISELDAPGEWCLDSVRQRAYFIPPEDVPTGPGAAQDYELSTARFPMMRLNGVSHARFEGLTWELGCGDGIAIEGGSDCVLAGSTVRRLGGAGISVSGERHQVLSCDVHTLGRGGVSVDGGNRKTLKPGGHIVENCHIYDLSRIDHTYTPAVILSGVGHQVRRNWFHHIPSSALRVGGNDHRIEFNEINHVVLESDDQGGVDMWGDPTLLGIVYRYNYFHHIGNWRAPDSGPDCGQAGIRLDDAISGVLIYRNVFERCGAGKLGFGGVQIHGGKDNVIDGNLFLNCRWMVSFSPWGQDRWLEFIKPRRQSGDVDPALYRARYESWDRQEGPANVNWIWRNTGVDCGAFLHRNSKEARPFANLVHPGQEAARVSEGKFDPASLPRENTGLYRTALRPEIPEALQREMRSER